MDHLEIGHLGFGGHFAFCHVLDSGYPLGLTYRWCMQILTQIGLSNLGFGRHLGFGHYLGFGYLGFWISIRPDLEVVHANCYPNELKTG